VNQPRPGHADHTAMYKYNLRNDHRGGGHLSGRMTIALVFLGAIVKQIIHVQYPRMKIISHINKINEIHDLSYYDVRKNIVKKIFKARSIPGLDVKSLASKDSLMQFNVAESIMQTNQKFLLKSIKGQEDFPVLSKNKRAEMLGAVDAAKANKDSLGGEIETIILNPPTNLGEPFFNSFESTLAHLIYSIPSIKGITFGNIDELADKHGSMVKDEIIFIDESKAYTLYNHNGGINGGISNGDDIIFRSTIKPVSSILQEQYTYDFKDKKIKPLTIKGRHDASIINRVIPIIEAVTYLCVYDLLLEHKKRQLLV
jgi:chorismate synthase